MTPKPAPKPEETALAKLQAANVPQKFSDDDFAGATKAGDYLPRLQLMIATSNAVKKEKVGVNCYAIVDGQEFKDIGKEIDCLVIAWRPKALKIAEVIISAYDPKSDQFKSIAEQSAVKDSGCMYGVEFLLYTAGQFVTFFMGSKSARRVAKQVKALMNEPATLKSQLIEGKKFSWFAPAVSKCSTPFDQLPSIQQLEEEVAKFNNPPESLVEEATDDETEGRAR